MLLISGLGYLALAGDSAQLDAAAARVALVPDVVGDWRGTDEPADNAAFAQTGARSYWTRRYVHQETKASVLVILMCGRAGKMAVHTPEVCYRGAGYELFEDPVARAVQPDHKFWSAQFVKKGGSNLRLAWAWNARGVWEAPALPRWSFRGEPFLYKLYVSQEVGTSRSDGPLEFLGVFVPELRRTLFPS
jgi:hypothetical protein